MAGRPAATPTSTATVIRTAMATSTVTTLTGRIATIMATITTEAALYRLLTWLSPGFPVGAFLATEEAAKGMTPGTHGSTFGGNPLAMAVGNAVLSAVLEPGFLEAVQQKARRLKQGLARLKDLHPETVVEVRGQGLLAGLKLAPPVADLVKAALAEKLRRATPHWMRHTHATHALDSGAELTAVRDNLRHSSISTTSIYLHADDERRARQIAGAFGVRGR